MNRSKWLIQASQDRVLKTQFVLVLDIDNTFILLCSRLHRSGQCDELYSVDYFGLLWIIVGLLLDYCGLLLDSCGLLWIIVDYSWIIVDYCGSSDFS